MIEKYLKWYVDYQKMGTQMFIDGYREEGTEVDEDGDWIHNFACLHVTRENVVSGSLCLLFVVNFH